MQYANVPYFGSAGLELVRSLHPDAGVAVCASSVRKTRAVGAPDAPSAMYMTVFPFFTFTAISGRAVVTAGVLTSAAWICVHVAPASVDFQTPRAYEPA